MRFHYLTLCLLASVLYFSANHSAAAQPTVLSAAVDVSGSSGPFRLSKYPTLDGLIKLIGDRSADILCDGHTEIDRTILVPPNIRIVAARPCQLHRKLQGTLRFAGELSAGHFTIFFGFRPGDVTFSALPPEGVSVVWWGQDGEALQSAIDAPDRSTSNGSLISIGAETIDVGKRSVEMRNHSRIVGLDQESSKLHFRSGQLIFRGVTKAGLENLQLRSSSDQDTDRLVWITGGANKLFFRNVYFEGGAHQLFMDHAYLIHLDHCHFQSFGYMRGNGHNWGIFASWDGAPDHHLLSLHVRDSLFAGAHVYLNGKRDTKVDHFTFQNSYFDSYDDAPVHVEKWTGGGMWGCQFEQQRTGGRNVVFMNERSASVHFNGNIFHGHDNHAPNIVLDGLGHTLVGNYFYRNNGDTPNIVLNPTARRCVVGSGNLTEGDRPVTVRNLGAHNSVEADSF